MKNKKKIFLTVIILIILVGILEVWKLNLKTTTLEQLKNSGHSQMMGYIIKTDNYQIIICFLHFYPIIVEIFPYKYNLNIPQIIR